jgi:glutathione synthase/RimK-type ligase-like ATP-grasp enzyme
MSGEWEKCRHRANTATTKGVGARSCESQTHVDLLRMILILSSPRDSHTQVIAESLQTQGLGVMVFDTGNRDGRNHIELRSPGLGVVIGDGEREINAADIQSIWYRRPMMTGNPRQLPEDRAAVYKSEWDSAVHSAMAIMCEMGRFWVNVPEAEHRAENKLDAFELAEQAGFRRLNTLVSNNPQDIRAFLQANGGCAVVKQFYTVVTSSIQPQVQLVTLDALGTELDDALKLVPQIYQEYAPTVLQLRVVVMGNYVVAGAVKPEPDVVDIRRLFREGRGTYTHYPLEESLRRQFLNLRELLDLSMVSFDVGIGAGGEISLFDINPSGNFLSLEMRDPRIQLTRPFTEYLAYGKREYEFAA